MSKPSNNESAPVDPISELINAIITAPIRAVASPAIVPAAPDGPSALDAVADLIPGRIETATTDLMNAEALVNFRTAYITGMIETDVLKQALDIVKLILVAKGII